MKKNNILIFTVVWILLQIVSANEFRDIDKEEIKTLAIIENDDIPFNFTGKFIFDYNLNFQKKEWATILLGFETKTHKIVEFLITFDKNYITLSSGKPIIKLGINDKTRKKISIIIDDGNVGIGITQDYNLINKSVGYDKLVYAKFTHLYGLIKLYRFIPEEIKAMTFGNFSYKLPKSWKIQGDKKVIKLIPSYSQGGFMEVYLFNNVPLCNKKIITRMLKPRKNTSGVKTNFVIPHTQNEMSGIMGEGIARLLNVPIDFKIISLGTKSNAIFFISYLTVTNTGARLKRDAEKIFESIR